jgi:hypothetical protein
VEVHHHPELPHGEKKRFKEYFLEFIMIFMAVTMGFIAENIREHLSDNAKEHEYIIGMIKNLEVDTTRLKITLGRNHKQIDGIDTLKNISKNKLAQLNVQDSLYLCTTRYLFNINNFQNDDITLSQLRNGGGYRLIRNQGVLDSIEVYEKKIQLLNEQLGYLTGNITTLIDMTGNIFDLNADRKFRAAPSSTPMLIANNKEIINGFYNKCFLISVSLKSYNQMLKGQLKYTTMLIAYLKKEYDIE